MLNASHSRAFIPGLLALVIALALFGATGRALAGPPRQDGTPPPDATPQPGEDPTPTPIPQACSECHLDVVSAWETGMHAQAYRDPIFQDAWRSQGNDPACLACHTTGYNPRTQTYAHEGVSCEACHGVTPANHPDEPAMTSPGPAVCEQCHATTVTEWEHSAHGEQQLACTSCHNPHPQQLLFENDSVALCLNCHEEPRDDYAHLSHPDQLCTDCHMHRAKTEDLLAHYDSGAQFPTGHEATVLTVACVSCHEELAAEEGTLVSLDQTVAEMGLARSDHPLLAAQVRIRELEAEVDTVRAQGQNTSVMRMIQGAVIGLVVGGVVVLLAIRWNQIRRRRAQQ